MKMICHRSIAVIFVISQVFIHGCVASEKVPVKMKNSLPENQLAHYNESFDKLRDDLWDRAGYAFQETQLENIKLADMIIDDGKLVIKTKTGAYSKGGLGSRYALRGDFDIQIDCQFDIFRETLNMDQLVFFLILDKTSDSEKLNLVTISLGKRGERQKSFIFTGYRKLGKYRRFGANKEIGRLRGSLRIVRLGSEVSTFYKEGSEGEWHRLGTISFNANDVMVGFLVTNFVEDRKDITASKTIKVTFDNFRINAAQWIVEEEI